MVLNETMARTYFPGRSPIGQVFWVDWIEDSREAREAIREIEPTFPIDGFMTQEQQIGDSYREERLYATLATTIGLVGVLLAAIGLYGLLAYQVAQRTQELGVRMALGATRGALARLVLAQSFRLAAAGALLGVLASLAGTRVLASVLFGLTATIPPRSRERSCCCWSSPRGPATYRPATPPGWIPSSRCARSEKTRTFHTSSKV